MDNKMKKRVSRQIDGVLGKLTRNAKTPDEMLTVLKARDLLVEKVDELIKINIAITELNAQRKGIYDAFKDIKEIHDVLKEMADDATEK